MSLLSQKIRVLIVDDSALVRKLLRDVIAGDPELEVVGMAVNGVEAIRAVEDLSPDVVTMDIHMPEMDGLEALEYIMRRHPLPVVMLSALAQRGAAATLRALELGAVDFITKPSHYPSAVKEVRDEVVFKVKTAARARPQLIKARARGKVRKEAKVSASASGGKLVVIGASAGGPKALAGIMPRFPEHTPASFLIVQHMPGVFTRSFAARLDGVCPMAVREAEEKDELRAGRILVVPGGKDLVVTPGADGRGRVELMDTRNRVGASPRIDTTMVTAAEAYGSEAVGVIMTGMGSDGANGMEKIRRCQGSTVAQDEETCLVFGMPKAAIERGCVDWVVSLDTIPDKVMDLL